MSMKNESDSQLRNSNADALVFLNTPIRSKDEDVIGLQAHVDSLQTAIDAGAQMIAVTSPFGAGKSSVTELLRQQNPNQRIIGVSMWSHLCKDGESEDSISTIDFHRSFLYQIVSQLNDRMGSYISRRLSKNYGLLKLHTESVRYYVFAFLALVLFILGYVLPYVFQIGIPTIWGEADVWNGLLILGAVICLVYVIVRAEIVFSSNKSEGARTIDENELIELYRKFVQKHCAKHKRFEKYIFVIEDLDRSDKNDSVITFLKELRKYYMQTSEDKDNKIVFIVNVKPETSLFTKAGEHKGKENETLYAKMFDYVLNIQTINIDDYETILESILQQNKAYIQCIFTGASERLVDIPGMQWIIYGKNFGVRDIKDRLNRAFTLFMSLRHRFPMSHIEFEKCAVVAYLTTAYEQEFINTDDRTFGKLVEAYLQRNLNIDLCKTTLNTSSTEYAKEIYSLIQAKHIDQHYRMYFYNYPKDSTIYSHEEHAIQNAILYGEATDGLDEMARRVASENVRVIIEALDRLKKLKLPLPEIIFKCEPLFVVTLRHYPDGIYEWLSKMDYTQSSFDKTSAQIINILTFDSERSVYTATHASRLCAIWEDKIKENLLLQLRYRLCAAFPEETSWYTQLFMDVHNIATFNELELMNLGDAIRHINIQKDTFDAQYIKYILERYISSNIISAEIDKAIQSFLSEAEGKLGSFTVVPYLVQYMKHIQEIIAEYEESIMEQLMSTRIAAEAKVAIFSSYQELINLVAPEKLTSDTLSNIQQLNNYAGYSEKVSDVLEHAGFIFEANINRLHLGAKIDFYADQTVKAAEEHIAWLQKQTEILIKLRLSIIKASDEKSISKYAFLFSRECPILTTNEFANVRYRFSDKVVLSLIPASLITSKEAPMLINYFNRRFQHNTTAYDYLVYISQMSQAVAKDCFYALDFEQAIKYHSFAADRKKSIKKIYEQILNLNAVSEIIRFMNATHFIDSAWEEKIYDSIRTNSTLQKSYVDALNNAVQKSITNNTVKCICSFSSYYALNDIVTAKLYAAKKYSHYVLCKALFHKRFILDVPDRIDTLWDTYMEIFAGSNHPTTREYMANNLDFLKLIIEKKAYTGLSNDRRNILCKVLQDAEALEETIGRGENYASSYYQKIAGFTDARAAETFVSIVENRVGLLRSQQLYDNCHEKLINATLKAKYTRLRKKHGFMK